MKQEILKNLALLLGSNDKEFLESIFASYLDTLNKRMLDIANAVESKDLKLIQQAAHSIKGCAATLHHTPVMEMGGRLEQLAKSGELQKCLKVIAEIKDYMDLNDLYL